LPPVGLLFMVGVWIAFKDGILYRGMQYKAQKGQHRDAYIVILAWLVILLVPEVLTWEGVPHALRSIGVIPPAMILAAIGADFLYERFVQPHHPSACATGGAANANSPRRYGRWRLCLFAVVLLSIGVAETYRYFIVWAANPATPLYFSRPYVKIGEYLNWEPY